MIVDDLSGGPSLLADVEAAGFKTIGPFTAPPLAMAWLEANTPDLAVIDPAFGAGEIQGLVLELRGRGVPFVVYSGQERTAVAPPELQSVPWFGKATARAEFVAALAYIRSTAAP